MLRWNPEVRALCARVRRPAMMFLVGIGLMAPAGALMLGEDLARPGAPGAAPVAVPAGEPAGIDEKLLAAKAAEGPLARAWKERALVRERQAVAEQFADRFEIPASLALNIYEAAEAEEIDPEVAFGLVRTESGFERTAISSVGAVGYTQLLPSTARWMVPGTSRGELFETRTNLRVGFRYLRYLLDKYDGDTRLALTAYNRGPGTVDRLLKRGRNPENGYATKVLSPKPGRRI